MKTIKMSIDGVIANVRAVPEGYEIDLAPRLYDQGDGHMVESIPGQDKLILVSPTWLPEKGMEIWGGGGQVFIVVKKGTHTVEREYIREGYIKIREREQ